MLEHPEYFDYVDEVRGTVQIKVPETKQKFGFRIGGQGEIRLMVAGEANRKMKFGESLWSFQKKKYSKSFKTHFLDKIKTENIEVTQQILINPFILAMNPARDFNNWNSHYVFKIDTLLQFPLPTEFDSLSYDFLENLISCYGQNVEQELTTVQYQSQFRVNKSYSGFVTDSIYVNSCYRDIGQPVDPNFIFTTSQWKTFTYDTNLDQRLDCYQQMRKDLTAKGYKATEVYAETSQEYWMLADSLKWPQ